MLFELARFLFAGLILVVGEVLRFKLAVDEIGLEVLDGSGGCFSFFDVLELGHVVVRLLFSVVLDSQLRLHFRGESILVFVDVLVQLHLILIRLQTGPKAAINTVRRLSHR